MFNVPKVLIFDLSAEYGQFRKFFTNMSPLSFSIPPRTVMTGIIGAIIGIDKKKNPELFPPGHSFVALRILSTINKTVITTNYIKTEQIKYFSRFKEHKPTVVEYVKNPRYRIYFYHTNKKIYECLKNNLINHRSFYTVNLGISSCLANFTFIGEFNTDFITANKATEIISILPVDAVKELISIENLRIQRTTMPVYMNNKREVKMYREYFFELDGEGLNAKVDYYIRIQEHRENIVGM